MSSKKYGSTFLKGCRSFRVSSEVNSEAVLCYLEALDCPRSLSVALLFKYKEHKQLVDLEFNPSSYLSYEECRDAYAATKFLSKYKDLSLDYDLDEMALKKFEEFELLCKQTNSRFRFPESDPLYKGRVVWLHNAIKRKISAILGEFDPREFIERPDWGPGASTLIKRRVASATNKFQCETGITRELYSLLPLDLLSEVFPSWAYHLSRIGFPNIQQGNRVVTVPKDAKANRVIAIEPGINLFFQKAIGDMIGSRLRRHGIDLRYQDRNQRLALLGSKTNQLATVDLSSASDSIARSVVEEFLPPRWFQVLDACRSHYGLLDNQVRKWEKFSSMGNGFTFQLESLIFFAVSYCCTEYLHLDSELKNVSAYGDDVILPSACRDTFTEMMNYLGFRINDSKSHFDSPFRESCGAHYYQGLDLKPIYLKGKVSSLLSVIRLANAVRRLSHRRMCYLGCEIRFRTLFDFLIQKVPKALRLRIPEGIGDGGFISNFDEATPSKAKHWIEGYFAYTLQELSKTYSEDRVGYLLARLWAMPELTPPNDWGVEGRTRTEALANLFSFPSFEGRNSVPLTGDLRLKLVKVLVQQWYSLGPWI